MNNQIILFCLCYLLAGPCVLLAGEIPWTPDTPYCFDRRQSPSQENPSAWASDRDLDRLEYRLTHLMEADRNAKKLQKCAKLPEADALLLYRTVDNLDEILEMSYHDAIKGLKAKPNPTLLLMMLYHYNAYVKSAMEGWEPAIDVLRKLDPAITEKAGKLAGPEKARKIQSPEVDGQPPEISGQPNHGLTSRIEITGRQFAPGKPIPVSYTVRNLAPTLARIWHSGFWPNHQIRVCDQNGKLAALRDFGQERFNAFSPGGERLKNSPEDIKPGGEDKSENQDIAQLYDLSAPGIYSVQVLYEEYQGGWEGQLWSNVIIIQILAHQG